MKKIVKLLLVLFPVMAISQTQTENYIKTVTYKVASTTQIIAPIITKASQNVTYFDGLGRPIQQVATQQSNSGKDIITHIKYDGFGRQVEEYLPFKSANTTMAFDPAAEANVLAYYASPTLVLTGNPAMEATANPYSRKELEASPLNRVLKQAAPGNDWKLSSGHEIKMDYQTNGLQEVKLFTANTLWDSVSGLYVPSFVNTGYYLPNQLYKTVTYDENTAATPLEANGSTVEFKNKEGQVVLKRTYATVGTGITMEKHDTYYIYDIYGNLTYVIPPKAVDLIGATATTLTDVTSTAVVNSGSTLQLTATNSIRLLDGFNAKSGSTFSAVIDNGTQNILDMLCYQYKYDYRKRLVEKKLPGKQWEFIVYDKLDRVVATGPANSPFSDLTTVGWLITKYDAFSRPVYTGWMTSTAATTAGRTTLQNAQNSASLTVLNESKQTTGTIDGIDAYYSNLVAPTSFELLSVNYYDNYTFPSTPTIAIPAMVETQTTLTAAQVKGLATASWVRVPTTSTANPPLGETSATFYDSKARPIRQYTTNFLGGYTYTDSSLDPFSGQLKYSITRHKRQAVDTELLTKDAFTYTAQDRLKTQTHQIGTTGATELIADNTYDELGQLIYKKVGNNIQKIDYTYNIRGWLTDINDTAALLKNGDPKDLFAFKINYNKSTTGITNVVPLYNGNIAETQWATNSDTGIVRSYGYKYDNLNRLKEGVYKNGTTFSNAYNETLWYDKNGNITGLNRNGTNESVTPIDALVYTYASNNNSNQLMKVVDGNSKTLGFVDSAANTVDDYSYDANGNMTKDNNKNITTIVYNHLNLPTKITFGAAGNIEYIYNASGQKVRKIVTDVTKPAATITDYLDGYQYTTVNSVITLNFFPTSEGYVEPSGSTYKYIYQYKDHLGNIRLSYDKTLAIKEESNYYPFGLKQEGYNNIKIGVENKYKYQGQERQDELSLNWDSFKWRNYDFTIGRFMIVDPLATDFPQWSPYVFSGNLVTMARELEGMEPSYLIGPDGKLTQGAVSVLNAAFGYTPKSLTNTTWIKDNDPRRDIVQNTFHMNNGVIAVTSFSSVAYKGKYSNYPDSWWMGTIAHEQRHRSDIDEMSGLGFDAQYVAEAFLNFGDEAKMLTEVAGYKNDKYGAQLWNYNGGEVASIFQTGNITENQRSTMLESVGNRFRRDFILSDKISDTQNLIKSTNGLISGLSGSKSDQNLKISLNNLINEWQQQINAAKKEQKSITNKYGK